MQKKHKLEWTTKAKLLLILSLPGFIPLISLFSPIFLIISQILIRPLEYYQKEKILKAAKEKLAKLSNLKIVAITGSFGKTSTKDILYTLLWKKYYVVKTPRSFNTPLGIAQTILEDIKDNTQIFICEMGAYKKGEIAKICKFIKPDIGMITAIAPQHLERFGSIENIAKAKFELVENLHKDGVAILNGESNLLKDLASHSSSHGPEQNRTGGNVIFYGNDKASEELAKISIPLKGENHIKNFVAAATVALQLGLTLNEIRKRAKLLLPTPHRLEIRKQNELTIIDNTFNTNPQSSRASLKLLQELPGSQKILITPGLVELGKESAKQNQEFAKESAKVADQIIIVGEYAKKDLLKGAGEKAMTVATTAEAMNLLGKIAKPDAVILLENDLPDQYS